MSKKAKIPYIAITCVEELLDGTGMDHRYMPTYLLRDLNVTVERLYNGKRKGGRKTGVYLITGTLEHMMVVEARFARSIQWMRKR